MQFDFGLLSRHHKTLLVTIVYFLLWFRLWWLESQIYLHTQAGDRIALGEGITYGGLLAMLFAVFLSFALVIKLWFNRDVIFCLLWLVTIWLPVVYMIWRQ